MQTAQETWTIQEGNAEVPHTRVAFALTETAPRAVSVSSMTRSASSVDDEALKLAELAKAGDRAALGELLEAMRPRAMAAALKVLRNQDDAEDAVQEAFVKIWRCIASFEGRSSVSTWVHHIVTNASLDLRRRNGNRSEMRSEMENRPDEQREAATVELGHEQTPEAELESHELAATVRVAIAALPATHRQAIELRDLEEYSYSEIAEITKCPLGTVMSRLHHARQKLASGLRAPLGDSPAAFAA